MEIDPSNSWREWLIMYQFSKSLARVVPVKVTELARLIHI